MPDYLLNESKPMRRDSFAWEFWQGLEQGKFLVQRCVNCMRALWYPRSNCVECGCTDLAWVPCSAKGTLYSYTIVAETATNPSYVLGLIELEDRIRVFARIEDIDKTKIAFGMKLTVKFKDPKIAFPCFVPE